MSPFGVVCAKCGSGMPMGAVFCGSCGARISEIAGEERAASQDDEATPPREEASAPKPVGVRMLIVAWALGIIAGFFLGRAFAPGTPAGGDAGDSRPAAGSAPPGAEDLLASARVASDAGRYAQARDLYRRVLENEPGNLSAHVDLGVAELALGDGAAARASFGAALAGPSPHPAAAYNLARLAEEAGDHPEAGKYYALYLELAPEGPRAANARAKLRRGDASR